MNDRLGALLEHARRPWWGFWQRPSGAGQNLETLGRDHARDLSQALMRDVLRNADDEE
ncbi:MAG: hypothetical protein IH945_02050 [Armatimonadetes bacterium]|nr:hypothetical protein [Armatimonadota bacterium]